jgi:hypothetical protein
MASKQEREAALNHLRARSAAPAAAAAEPVVMVPVPVAEVPSLAPAAEPVKVAVPVKAAGGRPPNTVVTVPLNLHVPEDLMDGLVQLAFRASSAKRRLTPQKIILELIRERVAHG